MESGIQNLKYLKRKDERLDDLDEQFCIDINWVNKKMVWFHELIITITVLKKKPTWQLP